MTTTYLSRFRRGAIALTSAAAVAATLSACGADSASADGKTAVTFAVGAPVLVDSTAPYTSVPESLGYWGDEGLAVTVQPTQGATQSMQLLLAGKADITNGGTSSIYQAAVDSPEIRVVSLQQENIWQISVPSSGSIKQISDLKGQKIGVQSLSSASYLFGRAAVAASGLDPDKDVEWIAVGVGNQAAQALTDGTVAAYATYTGPNAVVASVMGEELVDLPTPLDEIPGLSGIATTKTYLDEHRDDLVAFLKGYYESAVFSATNPAAALQIHWAKFPEQKPKGDTAAAVEATVPTVQSRYEGGASTGASGKIGDVSLEDAQKSIDFMYEYGIIDKKLNAADVVDTSVSVDANDFDVDAVKKAAQDWKP